MQRLGTLLVIGAMCALLLVTAGQAAGKLPQEGFETASNLIGAKVSDSQGTSVGTVNDLLIDQQTGELAYVVLSRGGMLGMGAKLYPIPWQASHYTKDGQHFNLDVSQDKLNSAPSFAHDSWPDLASSDWQQRLQSFYQTQGAGMGGTQGISSDRRDMADEHGGKFIRVSQLKDKSLQNTQGQKIATVDNLVIDLSTARVDFAIVGGGGLMGVGEKLHAVPWGALNYNASRQVLTLDASKQKIENAPSFKSDSYPDFSDRTWQSQINRYYGVQTPEGVRPMNEVKPDSDTMEY